MTAKVNLMRSVMPSLVNRFIGEAIADQLKCAQIDKPALKAIASGKITGSEMAVIKQWLWDYRVARRVPVEIRQELLGLLVKLPALPKRQNERIAELASQFSTLVKFVNKKTETDEPSAMSKLLWLKHPCDVPIYDSLSARTLCVLANYHRIEGDSYADYVRLVYGLFAEVRAKLEGVAAANQYAYPIRLLDKVLWYAGRPRFEPKKMVAV
jgi:hypothetical protein